MAHVVTLAFGTPQVSDTQVFNTFAIEGDTPDSLRIYTNPLRPQPTPRGRATVSFPHISSRR